MGNYWKALEGLIATSVASLVSECVMLQIAETPATRQFDSMTNHLQSLADMRAIAVAIEEYGIDYCWYPVADRIEEREKAAP